jgi:hypothetical protein
MPKFYFHIRDDRGEVADSEGMELSDHDAARREGAASAQDLLARSRREGRPVESQRSRLATRLAVWSARSG